MAGKGNPGRKDCLNKGTEVRTIWSLYGKTHEGLLVLEWGQVGEKDESLLRGRAEPFSVDNRQ